MFALYDRPDRCPVSHADYILPRRSCQRLHRDIVSGVAGDCTRSGTTLCAAVLNGRRLTVANVGDSGCVRLSRRTPSPDVAPAVAGEPIAASDDATAAGAGGGTSRRRGMRVADSVLPGVGNRASGSRGRLVAERLSRDHKPESAGELERIQAAGGLVFPLPRRDNAAGGGTGVIEATIPPAAGRHQATGIREQELTVARDFGAGVPRVWRAGGDGPGLAMSRSIGDKVILVLCVPSILLLGAPQLDVCLAFSNWFSLAISFIFFLQS